MTEQDAEAWLAVRSALVAGRCDDGLSLGDCPPCAARFALAAAGRILGDRLRAAAAEYGSETSALAAGLRLGWIGAAVAVESACGVAPGDEGKQGV